MAIKQASYQLVRQETIHRAISWALNKLNLRDWEVELVYANQLPHWADPEAGSAAQSRTLPSYFHAWIWVSPNGCKEQDFHPVSAALHEVLHILLHHYGLDEHDERMVNTLETILFQQWESERS